MSRLFWPKINFRKFLKLIKTLHFGQNFYKNFQIFEFLLKIKKNFVFSYMFYVLFLGFWYVLNN